MSRGTEAKTGRKKAESGSSTTRRAEASSSTKRAEARKDADAPSALTAEERKQFSPSQESHGYVVSRVSLRKWFWDRIDEEAKHCGYNRRTEFLNAMVRRKAGKLRLERLETLPKVSYPKPEELGPDEVYAWNIPVEVKVLLDQILEPLDFPVRAWVSLSTLEWLGHATVPVPGGGPSPTGPTSR